MKMRTVLSLAVPALSLAAVALPAASQEMSAEELTRMLNSRPARPAAQAAAAPVVQAQPRAVAQPQPVPASRVESDGNAMTRNLNSTTQAAPVASAAVEKAPQAEPEAPAPVSRNVTPSPAITQAPAATRRVDGPIPLSAQAIAALPFRIDLQGAEIIERPAGADGKVYSVRSGSDYLLMIYAGSQSQFPLYDGQQALVMGRYTTVVTQDGKRVAAEHLFRRDGAQPIDIHIWLLALEGDKAALAERIGQTVDPR